jgi:predicted transcriptional regulator of viral defense system
MTKANSAKTMIQRVLDLAEHVGAIRPRDLQPHGIPRTYLARLTSRGLLEKVGRGLYMIPDSDIITEHHTLVEATKAVPNGIACLLTALRFHNLTTQGPFEVWLALPERAWRPRIDSLPLRFMKFSKPSFEAGIEEHVIEGVRIRVYSAAKTVVDCFKYRNKVGLDVAIEALRDCRRKRKCTVDDLWRFAIVCRVLNVMRPYLEALA